MFIYHLFPHVIIILLFFYCLLLVCYIILPSAAKKNKKKPLLYFFLQSLFQVSGLEASTYALDTTEKKKTTPDTSAQEKKVHAGNVFHLNGAPRKST